MENNLNQNQYNQEGHKHSVLYFTIGISLGTCFLLLLAVGLLTYNGSSQKASVSESVSNTAPSSAQEEAQKTTADSKTVSVVPALIQSQKDLDDALKMYDNQAYASDSSVNDALGKNSEDLSSFSN